MLRRSLAALAVAITAAGLIAAGTYQGTITKVTDTELTILVKKDKADEGTKKTFKITKETKVAASQGKDKEAKDSTMDDLKKVLKEREEKGVRGKIETEGDGDKETVTKITFGGRRKKE